MPASLQQKAGREHEPEFAALRLGITGGNASLSHQAQLVFRHRSLKPEQQAVVDDSRIIGAIRIDNQCAGKRYVTSLNPATAKW